MASGQHPPGRPAERLKAEEAAADRRSKEKLEDLVVKLQPVNYAKASDVQPQIESLLSDRGSVNIDNRTNTLIIKDIPTVIDQAVLLVRKLDTRTPQVLIEAKIIEASLDFAKELGISYTADFLNPDIANGVNASRRDLAFGNRVVNSGTNASGSSSFAGALPIKGTPTGVAAASFTALKNALDIDVVVQPGVNGRPRFPARITTLDNGGAHRAGRVDPFQTTEEAIRTGVHRRQPPLTVTPRRATADHHGIGRLNAPDTVPTSTGDGDPEERGHHRDARARRRDARDRRHLRDRQERHEPVDPLLQPDPGRAVAVPELHREGQQEGADHLRHAADRRPGIRGLTAPRGDVREDGAATAAPSSFSPAASRVRGMRGILPR
jgi:type IV pilus assembly protein PilQ